MDGRCTVWTNSLTWLHWQITDKSPSCCIMLLTKKYFFKKLHWVSISTQHPNQGGYKHFLSLHMIWYLTKISFTCHQSYTTIVLLHSVITGHRISLRLLSFSIPTIDYISMRLTWILLCLTVDVLPYKIGLASLGFITTLLLVLMLCSKRKDVLERVKQSSCKKRG